MSWVLSDVFGDAAKSWQFGMGFALTGQVPVSHTLDVRFDWGGRWLDGTSYLIVDPNEPPRWGGQAGETTKALRVMPATLDLAYRFESWSRGRYWVPFVAAGPGFYDMQASFLNADAVERDHNLFRFGWNGRAGVQFQRTSGLYFSLESGLHYIDVPGKWSPMWDVSLGIGAFLPGRSH